MDPSNSPITMPSSMGSRSKKPSDPNKALRIARAADYPKEIWYLVACVIFLAALIRLASKFWSWRQVRNERSRIHREPPGESRFQDSSARTANGKLSIRRLPLAVLGAAKIVALRWTIPLRKSLTVNLTETSVVLGYLAALLIWELINTRNVTTYKQFDATYWANRAGTLAASQTTLIVALAGKNNIVSLLTGVSYEKLHIIHRGVARSVLVLIWVHFWGRWQVGFTGALTFNETWLRGGVVAAVAWSLIVFISWAPFRHSAFELFYYSHIILVFIVLISAYFHMQQIAGFGMYVWPALLVWAIDRFLRLVRIAVLNFPPLHRTSTNENTLELLSPDVVRLTVRRRARFGFATWRPAQTMFVTVPEVSRLPFESHPFTISSVFEKGSCERELVFIIKARHGFTARLKDAAMEAGVDELGYGLRKSVKVILDGPYGTPPDLSGYKTVVLFAGGTGITYCLPLFNDLVRRVRRNEAVCRRIVLVWSVRVPDHMKWVSASLVQGFLEAPSHLQIDIRVHFTSLDSATFSLPPTDPEKSPIDQNSDYGMQVPVMNMSSDNPVGSKNSSSSTSVDDKAYDRSLSPELVTMKGVKVEKGRPNVEQILKEEIESSSGPVSVDVCGPHTLADAVRATLRSEIAGPKGILKGRPSVTLHVEKFGM